VTTGNFAHEGSHLPAYKQSRASCIFPVRHALYSVVTSINSQVIAGFILTIAYCFVTQLMIHVICRTLTAPNYLFSSPNQQKRPSTSVVSSQNVKLLFRLTFVILVL